VPGRAFAATASVIISKAANYPAAAFPPMQNKPMTALLSTLPASFKTARFNPDFGIKGHITSARQGRRSQYSVCLGADKVANVTPYTYALGCLMFFADNFLRHKEGNNT
jgi:hypothetical protein